MRPHGGLSIEEANTAAWEATRGALVGASRWGIYTAILGVVGYTMSPVYRGLTLQFKTYLQMSGMIAGGMLEADSRLLAYEKHIRRQRRIATTRANQEQYGFDEPTPSQHSVAKQDK